MHPPNNSSRGTEKMLLDTGSFNLDNTVSQRIRSKNSFSSCCLWTVLAIAIVTMAYGLTETTLYFLRKHYQFNTTGACGSQGFAVGELRKPPMKYGYCDSGWTTANRTETGQKYCHRFFSEKLTYEGAEKKCQEHGAHLSGFTDQNELDVLDKMLDKVKSEGVRFDNGDSVWIGARRRAACSTREGIGAEKGGFNPDPTHPCSRLQAFEWVNGVAQNPPDFEDRWVAEVEPQYVFENCVELLKGVTNNSDWPRNVLGDKKVNDVPCDWKYYFFCGKEAPIVKTG